MPGAVSVLRRAQGPGGTLAGPLVEHTGGLPGKQEALTDRFAPAPRLGKSLGTSTPALRMASVLQKPQKSTPLAPALLWASTQGARSLWFGSTEALLSSCSSVGKGCLGLCGSRL